MELTLTGMDPAGMDSVAVEPIWIMLLCRTAGAVMWTPDDDIADTDVVEGVVTTAGAVFAASMFPPSNAEIIHDIIHV